MKRERLKRAVASGAKNWRDTKFIQPTFFPCKNKSYIYTYQDFFNISTYIFRFKVNASSLTSHSQKNFYLKISPFRKFALYHCLCLLPFSFLSLKFSFYNKSKNVHPQNSMWFPLWYPQGSWTVILFIMLYIFYAFISQIFFFAIFSSLCSYAVLDYVI